MYKAYGNSTWNHRKRYQHCLRKTSNKSNGGDLCKTPAAIFSHLRLKILAAIDEIRQKKKRPDIHAIYEHKIKSKALNADKNLIETIITELTKQNVIINKKTCHGLDSFYKSSTAEQSIDITVIKPSPSTSNNISNDKLTPQKQELIPIISRNFWKSTKY